MKNYSIIDKIFLIIIILAIIAGMIILIPQTIEVIRLNKEIKHQTLKQDSLK